LFARQREKRSQKNLPEDERQVARDAFLLQNLRGLDAFPGRGDLDQDARLVDPDLLVQFDEAPGLFDGGVRIEREAGVDLRRDVPRDDFCNFRPEVDGQLVLRLFIFD